jgi:hypothetical protein
MMWRGVRNCPFWPAGRDLRQHVFVDVALGVAVAHLELVELGDHLVEELRTRNLKARIAHMLRIGAAGVAEFADERKDVLVDDLAHAPRLEILEPRPAQIFIRLAALIRVAGLGAPVVPLGENPALQRLAEPGRSQLRQFLHLIEALDEDEIGDLLDHLQRIGDAARPEIIPDRVDLVAQFTGEHRSFPAAAEADTSMRRRVVTPLLEGFASGLAIVDVH